MQWAVASDDSCSSRALGEGKREKGKSCRSAGWNATAHAKTSYRCLMSIPCSARLLKAISSGWPEGHKDHFLPFQACPCYFWVVAHQDMSLIHKISVLRRHWFQNFGYDRMNDIIILFTCRSFVMNFFWAHTHTQLSQLLLCTFLFNFSGVRMYFFYDKRIAIKASFKEDPIHAHACAHTYTHTLPGDRFPRKREKWG